MENQTWTTSWSFNQPLWKIYIRQIGSWNPRDRGENKKYLSCHHLDEQLPNQQLPLGRFNNQEAVMTSLMCWEPFPPDVFGAAMQVTYR